MKKLGGHSGTGWQAQHRAEGGRSLLPSGQLEAQRQMTELLGTYILGDMVGVRMEMALCREKLNVRT